MRIFQPEYLVDTEAKRGKLEKSFTAIGSAVCIGSGLGGTYGLFTGEERRRYCAAKSCYDGGAVGQGCGRPPTCRARCGGRS